ncbi:hypothetical protein SLEP1_g16798 [Rubroshorea leprosula]|uniref:Uncharacterized protein n=1 Tax=Rubroshorea leprosula TaxID=152421 RepID=A0AAV5IS09_9ROSI|nr:hypothetical protein SLEP1_g16798 [Rubroshorea leprosula]
MSGMERLQWMFAGAGGALGGQPPPDWPTLDSSEQVYISSLALLKMLKHGTFSLSISLLPPYSISLNTSERLCPAQLFMKTRW